MVPDKAPGNMDVLVIEDHPLVRQGLVRALQQAGFTVTAVSDAMAAFAAIESRVFQAILCDIQLPLVNGQSLYEQLSENHPSLSNRVIFVTAMVSDPKVRAFLDRTGRPVVAKPFELSELISTVQAVAGQATMLDEPILGVRARDRDIARALPEQYLVTTGTPRERLTKLVDRHWPGAPDADRRQLEQILMIVLEPLARQSTVTGELRRQCEEAVMGWAVRQ